MNRLRASIASVPHRRRAVRFVALALWLALCLLGNRWVGLLHHADHSPLPGLSTLSAVTPASMVLQENVADKAYGSQHSCIAFDAAALGDTVSVPLVEATFHRAAANSAPEPHSASRPRHAGCPFSSRAPPVA